MLNQPLDGLGEIVKDPKMSSFSVAVGDSILPCTVNSENQPLLVLCYLIYRPVYLMLEIVFTPFEPKFPVTLFQGPLSLSLKETV